MGRLKWSVIMMSSSLKIVTLGLLCVNVSCFPGPDPGSYYFSKTVWEREKEVPSNITKKGVPDDYDYNYGPGVPHDYDYNYDEVSTTPCSAGWTYLKHTGECYKSVETTLTSLQAILACKGANAKAHLAVIPDKTTNDFVLSIMKTSRSWIGLSKVSNEWFSNDWHWADGTKTTYTNWIPNEPSGDGPSVEIVRNVWKGVPGQWNDKPVDDTRDTGY